MRIRAALALPIVIFITGSCFYFLHKADIGLFFVGVFVFFIGSSYIVGKRLDQNKLLLNKLKNEVNFYKENEEHAITNMFDSAVDLVFLLEIKANDLYCSSVNKSFLRSTGFSKNKVLGQKAVEIFGTRLLEKCRISIEEGASSEFIEEYEFPAGNVKLDFTIHPIQFQLGKPAYLVGVAQVISGKKQAEELVKETENHFQFITENATDIILKLAADSTFLYASPIIEKIMGYKPKDILFIKTCYDFIYPDDKQLVYENQQYMLKSDEIITFKFRAFRSDGKVIWLEATGKKINQVDLVEFIWIIRDSTERIILEQRLREANERLEHLSYIDGLTNVGNRRKFDRYLLKTWGITDQLSVLMFDIDCFKEYNDKYGHIEGDKCLTSVAGALKQNLRHTGAELFRYGGEEFIILYPNSSLEEAMNLGYKILFWVEELKIPHSSSEISNFVTVSIGVVNIGEKGIMSPNDAVDYADRALYRAKRGGRNKVISYHELPLEVN